MKRDDLDKTLDDTEQTATKPMPRLISCDESGFTGNDMMNGQQRYFAYAAHDLSLEESEALVAEARRRFPVQMTELKAQKLLGRKRGRDLIAFVLGEMEGRYIAVVHDKRLCLCGKLFEYIYETVLQTNNGLFYSHGLHRFVAMYLYMHLDVSDATFEVLAREFEAFMRSLDVADAPTLFGASDGSEDPLIGQILRFARGYRDVIVAETRSLEGGVGKWVLDLTSTAVFSLLAAWSERHPVIEVVCDDSKPLRAIHDTFDAMIDRNDNPVVHMFGKSRPITWNMSGKLQFASSASHAGVQLADLIAGVAGTIPLDDENEEVRGLGRSVGGHLHEDCILPDYDMIDIDNDRALVNWIALEQLAERADAGEDPLEGMALFYASARAIAPELRRQMLED